MQRLTQHVVRLLYGPRDSVGIGHCPIPSIGLLDFGPNGDIQSNSNSNGLCFYNFGQVIL